jgi:hypothetical protein
MNTGDDFHLNFFLKKGCKPDMVMKVDVEPNAWS